MASNPLQPLELYALFGKGVRLWGMKICAFFGNFCKKRDEGKYTKKKSAFFHNFLHLDVPKIALVPLLLVLNEYDGDAVGEMADDTVGTLIS